MTTYLPAFVPQGPADHCVINGIELGWFSCTSYSTATLIAWSTGGDKEPTGCAVRRLTGDTHGGLTVSQMVAPAAHYGVHLANRAGTLNYATPKQLAQALREQRAVIVQGNTRPLLTTSVRSTLGAINHCVCAIKGRGWRQDGTPTDVLVYDPAADGRRDYVDQGATWWPWETLLRFAAALMPFGETDPKKRTVGAGHVWCGIGPSTGPTIPIPPPPAAVTLRYGGVRTSPFPDRTRAVDPPGSARVNVRKSPGSKTAKPGAVVDLLEPNELFTAYQRTSSGASLAGSRVWYGDKAGTRWVHASGLTHKGGTT